ncbi:MAG: SIS domain-containing protein [Chlamydiia bacterium]|nr:SIS domain-containing protein [Chlamydiia bacterium]
MFAKRFHDLSRSFASTVYTASSGPITEDAALEKAFEMLGRVHDQRGIAYVIGNGGSAGIASHFSTDLIKSLKIPSSTLFDSNLVTCLSNDYGYDQVFCYPLEHILRPNDLLVAISSSGKSPNIIQAAQVALRKGVSLITLSGFSDQNPLRTMGDLNFWVAQNDYGLVETTHFFLLHTIIDFWNQQARVKEYARILGSTAAKQN